jgi:predicted RNA binding protein YcfA (HicA-like mRNA interferase family)
MPARAGDLERVAKRLGFAKARQHPDGRATTIPIHDSMEIGGWLFHEILTQLGISEERFRELL